MKPYGEKSLMRKSTFLKCVSDVVRIFYFQIFGFSVRLSEPLLNQNRLKILKAHKKLRRFHSEIPKKDLIEALW